MRSSRVSVIARFGSAAAVAGLALAGALAPVSASAATAHRHLHKLPAHLFVRAHGVKGTQHKTDDIVGLLRSRRHGLADETVYLYSKTPHNKFAEVSSATTSAHGLVSFTVTPTTRTLYVLVFKGDATHRATHSAVIVLRAPKSS